jgi:DNA-binding MarR family transcriptional regulator
VAAVRNPEKAGEDAGLGEGYRNLNKLLEHRLRLAISVLLSRYDRLSFSRLLELTEETNGNLGANLRRLEDARYVTAHKEFVERKPVTWYQLTAAGRKALQTHLAALDELLRDARR